METNLGTLDRIMRFLVGLLVIGLGYVQNDSGGYLFSQWLSWPVGLMTIATAVLGKCPIYRVLGISTCPRT